MNTRMETASRTPSATVITHQSLIGCHPAVTNATLAIGICSECSRDPCRFGPTPSGFLLAGTVIDGQNGTVSDQAADTDATGVVEAAGHFRIYLGAVAGVGKTYAMLNEGNRRHGRGTDVVIGFVETHGRPHTMELTVGLEAVPLIT